jgi:phosphohistidine phosphatase SixA/predicted NUDIX family NTP pyrophosphohydrolase
VIPAAGALPWRRRRGELQVALVHRPAYDDWAWSKGKLDPGEDWPVAAVREVEEEAGLVVRLGRPLPTSAYTVLDRRSGILATKEVRYWAAEVVGGTGKLVHEIDEVAWLDVTAASAKLDYARDRDQLRALVRADLAGALTTWPLAVVRHAKALSRASWRQPDPLRPLDARGLQRAAHIVPLLTAYGVSRVVTSPSTRCVQTVEPYARSVGAPPRLREGLSEEGYAQDSGRAIRHLHRMLERGTPASLCTHGPVLPELLRHLAKLADADSPQVAVQLEDAAETGMAKGEVVVTHVVGTGETARVVDLERYTP